MSRNQKKDVILLHVTKHLDNYTIKPFLEAFPHLKQSTVLVTDHHFPPLFFDVEGVRRVHLGASHCTLHEAELYTTPGGINSQYIKLFEFAFPGQSIDRDVDLNSYEEGNVMKLGLDSRSFVFLNELNHYFDQRSIWNEQLNRLGCKWHLGHPLFPFQAIKEVTKNRGYWCRGCNAVPRKECVCRRMLPPWRQRCEESSSTSPKEYQLPPRVWCLPVPYGLSSSASCLVWKSTSSVLVPHMFGWVESLHLNNSTEGSITAFQALNFPQLKNLVLFLPQVGSLHSPFQIRDITVPRLETFVVHYNTTPPVISEIHTQSMPVNESGYRVFELIDVRFNQHHKSQNHSERHSSCLDPLDIFLVSSQCDMGFLRKFTVLKLVGVPFAIVGRLDLSNIDVLNWDLTLDGDVMETRLSLPELRSLSLNITALGVCLPEIWCPQLATCEMTVQELKVGQISRHMGPLREKVVCRTIFRFTASEETGKYNWAENCVSQGIFPRRDPLRWRQ